MNDETGRGDGVEAAVAHLLEGWALMLSWPLGWGDMDSFGHVNNTVYFRFFEHVRIAYFEHVGFTEHMKQSRVGPILAHTSCRFRLPLTYPDTVTLATRVDEVGVDRFTMLYRVVSHAHRAVAAEGDGRIVVFDYEKGVKAPLPDAIRAAMLPSD